MFNYKISPQQPLLFRDGKPFGRDTNIADTLPFPLPSTLAGAMRTAWADQAGKDYSNKEDIEAIKRKSVCGPLLTYTKNQKTQLLFPTPADSTCLKPKDKNESYIYRLKPQKMNTEGEGINLPNQHLSPVFMLQDIKGKPAKDSPKFWHENNMLDWLQSDDSDKLIAKEQGIQNLPVETRTHVAIKKDTQTAKNGHLFQTTGLDFGRTRKNQPDSQQPQWGWQNYELGLACQFQEEIKTTYRSIGGESRLARIEQDNKLIPDCPNQLAVSINQQKGFRLILVTPAIFKNGYLPDWIKDDMTADYRGMKLKLHAVSINRWQAGISWDMAANNDKHNSKNGKGMNSLKRLAPSGSVYWFEIIEGTMQSEGFWLTSISDERDNDGYGLTLPGIWNCNQFKEENNA